MLAPSRASTAFLLALGRDFHDIGARVLVELVELEVAVVVARGLGDQQAAAQQPHARALDAVDDAVCLRRERAADEAFRIAPQVAVIDARLGGELGPHHFEALVARHPRHLVVLDADRAHGAGRARLVAARLLPALVEQVRVERPDLRHLVLLVPPDVAVGAGVDQVLAPLRLVGIDEDDAVVAFLDRAAALGHAGRVVAVVAHGGNVGDVDHRHLPALLLQDVDPLVAVPRHRLGVARPVVADIFVHGRERAQVAIGALGDVDDHVPFFHYRTRNRSCCRRSPAWSRKRVI